MHTTRLLARALFTTPLFAAFIGSATAQDFPSKPIRFVVANSPATSPDIIARILAPEMSKVLGQPIVIENRPGAGAAIGYEYVAKRVPADGYTFVPAVTAELGPLLVTVKDLRFDPLKDLPAFIGVAEQRYVLGTSSKHPWNSFNAFVAHAKANPGKLNYGSASSVGRLTSEAILKSLGLEVTYIPYGSGGPYIQALVSGELDMGLVGQGGVAPLGDRFRLLALTGDKRSAAFPDVPTFAELGFPQIPGIAFSLNVPVGTPKEATDKLHAAASRALQQSDVRAQFSKGQLEIVERSAEAANKKIVETAQTYADIARKVGIQPQ